MEGIARKALVVDDSVVMREMICFVLESDGFRCCGAEDGIVALGTASQQRFDLIVTDCHMPGMDGLAFIEAVRRLAHCRTVPILVLTTETSDAAKVRARAGGASGWLVKPFSPQTLLDVVRKVTARH